MSISAEELACTPAPIDGARFNHAAIIPFGLTIG